MAKGLAAVTIGNECSTPMTHSFRPICRRHDSSAELEEAFDRQEARAIGLISRFEAKDNEICPNADVRCRS